MSAAAAGGAGHLAGALVETMIGNSIYKTHICPTITPVSDSASTTTRTPTVLATMMSIIGEDPFSATA